MAQSDLGKGIEDGTTVGISAMTTAGHDKQDKTAQRVVIGQLRFRSRKRSVRVQDQSEGAEFSRRRGWWERRSEKLRGYAGDSLRFRIGNQAQAILKDTGSLAEDRQGRPDSMFQTPFASGCLAGTLQGSHG